ncbi:hypothetical protein [Caldicellulosiruptor hydrothermalis]|nr:hypothetical protein [Caldicellulosiruptor hydrothermalis]
MVNGQRYIQVVNFLKYQKINRPTPSKIPPPPVETTVKNATSCFSESSLNTHGVLNEYSLNTHEVFTENSLNTHEQFTAQIEKEKEKENKNNKDVVTNVTTSRTGSDEPACVAEEYKISTSTQEKKLEGEQGMAVTSEPEQVTETAVQLDTNNNALNTTGEDELEQLLEEFFEDEGEPAENQDTAKTKEPLAATGEGEKEKSSDPVEVPGNQETAKSKEHLIITGVELEDSEECSTIPQAQDTAITDEIELLEGFFKDSSDQCTTIDTATCDSTPFAERKDTATACMTVAESMDSKVVEIGDFVRGVVENFKQELETSPASEPVTQDKLKEISQILQQNKIECRKRDAPATNDDDFQEEEKEIQELTNQKLIARLVGKYRRVTGMKSKDDFPRIGHLYLEFNYAIVEQAIGVIEKRIKQNVKIKDPVAYLYKVCEGIEKKMEERHEKYKKKENKGRHYSLINFSPEVLKIVEGGYQNDL